MVTALPWSSSTSTEQRTYAAQGPAKVPLGEYIGTFCMSSRSPPNKGSGEATSPSEGMPKRPHAEDAGGKPSQKKQRTTGYQELRTLFETFVNRSKQNMICYGCGESGHTITSCQGDGAENVAKVMDTIHGLMMAKGEGDRE